MPEYDYISSLEDGYIMLIIDNATQIMDDKGHIISPTPEYKIVDITQNKICIQSMEDEYYGLMDINGTILIEPEYEHPLSFSDGLASVVQNGKVGYINMDNELIIDYKYDLGVPFSNELAAVCIGDQYWFIDTKGDIVSGPYIYLGSEIFEFTHAYMEYSENYTAYFEYDREVTPQGYNPGGVWGYLNKQGEKAIPAQFITVRPFHDGLAAVEKITGEWIYIDKDGNEVFKGTPSDFREGLTCFEGHIIDTTGEILFDIPKDYALDASIADGVDGFKHGLIVLGKTENGNNTYAIMNNQGEIIMESDKFDELKIIRDNMIAAKTKGKWGIIEI